MHRTSRSRILQELLPAIHAATRAMRMGQTSREETVQRTLLALTPHIDRLVGMSPRDRLAYAFVAASNTGKAVRRRAAREAQQQVAQENQMHPDAHIEVSTPERIAALRERALRAGKAYDELRTQDRWIVDAISDDGISEREAAKALGLSRGSLAFRLRRAREALARAWKTGRSST